MTKLYLLARSQLRSLLFAAVVGASLVVAGLYGTADTNLTSAESSITSYFTSNIVAVIGTVVGICLFFWLVKVVMHSVGIRKAKTTV